MFGWICYFIALLVYMASPLTNMWAFPLVLGMLFHWKWILLGGIAFLVGAGWNKPSL